MNPFSDMYAFTGNPGDNTSSSNANENPPNAKKKLSDALEVESAFGTYNKCDNRYLTASNYAINKRLSRS
ncbi:hypothetical protein Hanom_Chr00s000002g01601131 [Helianthus anomalus]